MARHRKPIDQAPSPLVARYGEEIARTTPGEIIDVPCGFGRNAAFIASHGAAVTCLDADSYCLEFIDAGVGVGMSPIEADRLRTRLIDLLNEPWPYEPGTVGAIVSVHWAFHEVIRNFAESLMPGGLLLLESIDDRGDNHRALPAAGFIAAALEHNFEFRYLRERSAGPRDANAVTTKAFAVKKAQGSL